MGTDQGLLDKRKARRQMKTGLVLEGGAMRGIYTAGVLDVFLENQIHFDGVIGVSAGEEVSGIIKNTGMTNIL